MPRLNSAADLGKFRKQLQDKNKGKRTVSVTNGTDGRTRHSEDVLNALKDEIKKRKFLVSEPVQRIPSADSGLSMNSIKIRQK